MLIVGVSFHEIAIFAPCLIEVVVQSAAANGNGSACLTRWGRESNGRLNSSSQKWAHRRGEKIQRVCAFSICWLGVSSIQHKLLSFSNFNCVCVSGVCAGALLGRKETVPFRKSIIESLSSFFFVFQPLILAVNPKGVQRILLVRKCLCQNRYIRACLITWMWNVLEVSLYKSLYQKLTHLSAPCLIKTNICMII